MDIKLKPKSENTIPFVLRIEDEEGKQTEYHYQIQRVTNLELIHAASGASEAEYGTMYRLVTTAKPEGKAPPLQELVNKMDLEAVQELHQGLTDAAMKDLPGEKA